MFWILFSLWLYLFGAVVIWCSDELMPDPKRKHFWLKFVMTSFWPILIPISLALFHLEQFQRWVLSHD